MIDHVHAQELRTAHQIERRIERELLPVWGNRAITTIKRHEIRELLREAAKRAPIGANRLLAVIRKIFNWALDEGIIDASPATRLAPPARERERDRVLSEAEIRSLWSAFDELGHPYGSLFKMLLITGQRRREVSHMQWREIDGDVWHILYTAVTN